EGGASMPRSVTARSRERGHEPTSTGVDELIQRGRGQGHISLPELRAAFGRPGISPAEGRSIIRELAEAGVQFGNGVQVGNESAGATATAGASTGKEAMKTAKPAGAQDVADLIGLDSLDGAATDAAAAAAAAAQ